MKRYSFKEQSMFEDWLYSWTMNGITAWDPVTQEVILTMTPDFASWDDYGYRQRSTFPISSSDAAPWLKAVSGDGTGLVTLIGAGVISLAVPTAQISRMGPGTATVGCYYRRIDSGERRLLFTGRLPLLDTGGA